MVSPQPADLKTCPSPAGALEPTGAGPPLRAQEAALDWPVLPLPERRPGLGVSETTSRSNSAFYCLNHPEQTHTLCLGFPVGHRWR